MVHRPSADTARSHAIAARIGLALIPFLIGCQTRPPDPARANETTNHSEASFHSLAPQTHPARAAIIQTHTLVDGREARAESEGAVAITLDHQTGALRTLRLDDPIGPLHFVIEGAEVRVRIDGVETLLVDAESTGALARADAQDLCLESSAETTWPAGDALSASRRVDTFELCRDRGLVSRERVTTFPTGTRRQRWTLQP